MQVVRLSFAVFCTEPNVDFVKVYDGKSTASPLLMSSSGCEIPGPVTTTQRYMYVTFTSDGIAVDMGFGTIYNLE